MRCTLVVLTRAGAGVAGTWTATYRGTAQVKGTTAILVSQLAGIRVESPAAG